MNQINDQICIEDFRRCVSFSISRVPLYARGEVSKTTIDHNIDCVRESYLKVIGKSLIPISSLRDAQELERKFKERRIIK